MNGRERCRLAALGDGWVLAVDDLSLVLPAHDGAGPYVTPPRPKPEPRIVLPTER